MTQTLTDIDRHEFEAAIRLLHAGGVVGIPTDTVYGLAASLDHPSAIERIFEIKGRPLDKAIPVLIGDAALLDFYGHDVQESARRLARVYWPGRLTIIVAASGAVPPVVLRGGTTVGLRVPENALTLAIIVAAGGALAVTSANESGFTEARTADEVHERLGTLVDAIVDGGSSPCDSPSTVVDTTCFPVRLVRAGAIAEADIHARLNDAQP